MRRQRLARLLPAGVFLALGCQNIVGIEDRRFEPAEIASAECKAYCDAVMQSCTGANAAYPERATCIATCAKLPSGEATADNSLECRSAQAELASNGEPEVHCAAAGPFGAGTCGSTCQAYCTLLSAACPDKLTGISDCEASCAGLRVDGSYNLSLLASGDNLECRVAHAALATRDPAAHCASAAFKSGTCADPADSEPACEDFCTLVGAACTGANLVYETQAQCLAVCAVLDKGKSSDQTQNTVGCRKYHAYNSIAAPAQHCAHTGPAGDGHCGKDNCEAYCQLVSRTCKTEFAATFGDETQCLSECAKLPGANADTWAKTEKTGNTVRCRAINAARASETPAKCADAVGGGECT